VKYKTCGRVNYTNFGVRNFIKPACGIHFYEHLDRDGFDTNSRKIYYSKDGVTIRYEECFERPMRPDQEPEMCKLDLPNIMMTYEIEDIINVEFRIY
jgi:hypothetical protein